MHWFYWYHWLFIVALIRLPRQERRWRKRRKILAAPWVSLAVDIRQIWLIVGRQIWGVMCLLWRIAPILVVPLVVLVVISRRIVGAGPSSP
jgi:hypothetical protein